ncbi:MAG: hypothetical protein KDJ27_21850, partial [Gammaproteobacteria bacterium]|nr:hypothetical protein [Gammaproteobacteria bacterium]
PVVASTVTRQPTLRKAVLTQHTHGVFQTRWWKSAAATRSSKPADGGTQIDRRQTVVDAQGGVLSETKTL